MVLWVDIDHENMESPNEIRRKSYENLILPDFASFNKIKFGDPIFLWLLLTHNNIGKLCAKF